MSENTVLKYLGKADIDKSFKKLKKEKIKIIETDYDKCCETIKHLKETILSKYGTYLNIEKNNLEDITKKLKQEFAERNEEKYRSYMLYYDETITEEEYITKELEYNYGFSAIMLKKYIPTKKEGQRVLYFSLKKDFYSRSNYNFSFCAYYNSENVFCFDKITFQEHDKEQLTLEFETAETLPDKIIELLEQFVKLNEKEKEKYKKKQAKQEKDKIKRYKIENLKKKAGIVNAKNILDKINCSYRIEEMNSAIKIHISLDTGSTSIKIPKKNLNESLEYLAEFVETILKAAKLKIYFRHLQH